MVDRTQDKTVPRADLRMPASLEPCFQEYDFGAIDLRRHEALVLERVLAYGNRSEVGWLLAVYGRPRVSRWLRQSGAKRLPRRRYNLWCVMFEVEAEARSDSHPTGLWPH